MLSRLGYRFMLLLVLLLVLLSAGAFADEIVVLSPCDDIYTNRVFGWNDGSSSELYADYLTLGGILYDYDEAFVKFDLSGVTGTVVAAELVLPLNVMLTSVSCIYIGDDAWSETDPYLLPSSAGTALDFTISYPPPRPPRV